jgi:hypothetical protein
MPIKNFRFDAAFSKLSASIGPVNHHDSDTCLNEGCGTNAMMTGGNRSVRWFQGRGMADNCMMSMSRELMKNAAVKPGKNKSARTDPHKQENVSNTGTGYGSSPFILSPGEACNAGQITGQYQTGLSAIPQVAAYCKVKSLYPSQIFIVELIRRLSALFARTLLFSTNAPRSVMPWLKESIDFRHSASHKYKTR